MKFTPKLLTIIFAILLVGVCAIIFWFKPSEADVYHHNGPLSLSKDFWSQTASPSTDIGSEIYFGSVPLRVKKTPITLLSIEPTNVPKNVNYRVLGYTTKNAIGIIDKKGLDEHKGEFGLKPLPLKITDPNQYLQISPVIAISANKPGLYTIQGLLVTYKYKGKLYKEYYRTQFNFYCEISKKKKVDLPPVSWEGISPN